MKVQPQGDGRGTWETGFRRVGEGWHVGKFLEGIDYLKKKDTDGNETISANKQGDKSWKIPTVIEDEDDEFNEVKHDIIVAENKRGEQMVADILGATGLYEKFTKVFKGDEGIFDPEVIKVIKTKLPGNFWRFKVKHVNNSKDPENPYINIIGFGKMSDTVANLDVALFTKKDKEKAVAASKAVNKSQPEADVEDPFA